MVSKVNLRLFHFISVWWISIVCQIHSSSDRFCITFVSAYCFLHFPVFVASDAHLFSPHARFRTIQFSHYSDLASFIFPTCLGRVLLLFFHPTISMIPLGSWHSYVWPYYWTNLLLKMLGSLLFSFGSISTILALLEGKICTIHYYMLGLKP